MLFLLRSGIGEHFRLVAQNQPVQHGAGRFLVLRIELRYGFELKPEIGVRSALVLSEKELIGTDTESDVKVADDIKRGLRGSALVAAQLHNVNAHLLGESLLGHALRLSKDRQTIRKSRAGGLV